MKDSNQMIRYLGFQGTADGGRRMQFSVDKPADTSVISLVITVSGKLFTGARRISFQEAVGICSTKVRKVLEAGTLSKSSGQMELTTDDVDQYREQPKGRHRA